MILVDTPAWIDFFRGKKPVCDLVDEAIEHNDAAICGPIITEIRRGIKSVNEREKVIPLFDSCHFLEQPHDLWAAAGELGFFLARRGITVKTMDLLIATYALGHEVPVMTMDSDFFLIQQAGISLVVLPPQSSCVSVREGEPAVRWEKK